METSAARRPNSQPTLHNAHSTQHATHTAPNTQVQFPEPRLALLTASAGAFSTPGDTDCKNRVFFDRSLIKSGIAAKVAQTTGYTAPCGRECALGARAAPRLLRGL